MTEQLFQYIWQFQYFNKSSLITTTGEAVSIIHQGNFNTNQGPDFLDAKVQIGTTIWGGNIEIHIKSSDWNLHKHTGNKDYKNVMLHVVWENDAAIETNIPTLVLQDRVSKILLQRYNDLMLASSFIPCQNTIATVPNITWMAWKQRLLVERLQQKSQVVLDYLTQNNNHWEETFWWMLAKNFGAKVNSDAFEAMAKSIPINILAKHKNQIHQLEALLFGQAGLLDDNFKEDYPILLKKEYQFLKTKYQLKPTHSPLYFLRMRPANFPTIRLAQLAMLVHQSIHLFSKIKETIELDEIKKMFNLTPNDYWHYHYTLDELTTYKEKNLGTQMIQNLIINTVVPITFAYGFYYKDEAVKEKALRWLEQTSAEQNVITKGFAALSIENKTAYDSQALIQLKNEYCNKRKCLSCAIGNKLLKEKG